MIVCIIRNLELPNIGRLFGVRKVGNTIWVFAYTQDGENLNAPHLDSKFKCLGAIKLLCCHLLSLEGRGEHDRNLSAKILQELSSLLEEAYWI